MSSGLRNKWLILLLTAIGIAAIITVATKLPIWNCHCGFAGCIKAPQHCHYLWDKLHVH